MAAFFLSGLCCLEHRLPQGAPTSPAIANLVAFPMDDELTRVSKFEGVVYSRYADDLSFSSNAPISAEFRTTVSEIVRRFGFQVQRTKTRLMGPAIRREVTGLTVNQQVSIPRQRRRELRAYFHQIGCAPDRFADEKQRAVGFARWLYDYHPAEGAKALEIASRIPEPQQKK
jgi:RNA-directed DNA polymerase